MILDAIEKLADILASWIAESHNAKELEKILELLIFLAILVFVFFARQIMRRIPFVRRRINEGERYAGRYVQIIGDGLTEDTQYLIFDMDHTAKAICLSDFNMIPKAGGQLILKARMWHFDEVRVLIWNLYGLQKRWQTNLCLMGIRKCTLMIRTIFGCLRVGDSSSLSINNLGDLIWSLLSFLDIDCGELGLQDPKTDDERSNFVKQLHEKLSKDAEVRTVKEVGRALL